MKLGLKYQDGGKWYQNVEAWDEGELVPTGACVYERGTWNTSGNVGFLPNMQFKYRVPSERVPCEPPADEWQCPQYLYFAAWTDSENGRIVVYGESPPDLDSAVELAEEKAREEMAGDTWHVLRCEIIGDVVPATYKPREGK